MQLRAVGRLKPGILKHDAARMPIPHRIGPRDEDERTLEPAQRVAENPQRHNGQPDPRKHGPLPTRLVREQLPHAAAGRRRHSQSSLFFVHDQSGQ